MIWNTLVTLIISKGIHPFWKDSVPWLFFECSPNILCELIMPVNPQKMPCIAYILQEFYTPCTNYNQWDCEKKVKIFNNSSWTLQYFFSHFLHHLFEAMFILKLRDYNNFASHHFAQKKIPCASNISSLNVNIINLCKKEVKSLKHFSTINNNGLYTR